MSPEEQLVEDFNNKKRAAWKKVHELLYPIIVRFTGRIIDNRQQAEDIVTELFREIYENGIEFESMGLLKSYLYKYGKNRAIDYLRKRATEAKNMELLHWQNTQNMDDIPESDLIARTELCNQVKAEIENLSPQRREAVKRKLLEGLTPEEIADAMKLNRSTVYNHIQAGKALIRNKFPKFPLKKT